MTKSRAHAPSGLLRRLAAIFYDLLLLAAVLLVLTAILVALRRGEAIAPRTWWLQALVLVTSFLFYGWFWTHGGQTLGMRAWRLRVLRADDRPLTWPDAMMRYAGAWLALLPLGLGFWWCLVDRERRCWHDRLSRTKVEMVEKRAQPPR